MVISDTIKGYRYIVKLAYEKTKDNPHVFIDIRIKDLLNK